MRKIILITGMVLVMSFGMMTTYAQSESIPKWIKGVAGFWAEDKITDSEFIEVLEFLINQDIIKIDDQNVIAKESENIETKENLNKQTQLASCIDLELSSIRLVDNMIDHTNSKNLPPNSYEVFYPDSLLDDLSSVVQQSFLQNCVDLIVPIYLDLQIKQEGRALINYVISSVDKYGYDEPESCAFEPRCIQSKTSFFNLGNNSVRDDMILLGIFLELDLLLS